MHEACSRRQVTNTGKGQYDVVSGDNVRVSLNRSSTSGWTWNPTSGSYPSRSSTPRCDRPQTRDVTINGALAIDIQGQVVADTISGGQFSGIERSGGLVDRPPNRCCRTAP